MRRLVVATLWDLSELLAQLLVLACVAVATEQEAVPMELNLSASGRPSALAIQLFSAGATVLTVRCVGAMRGFEATAHNVDVLLASAIAILPLLLVLAVIVTAAGTIFYLQFSAESARLAVDDEFIVDASVLSTAIAAAYKMGMLGEFSTAEFSVAASPAVVWLLFLALTLLLFLVGVNSVIAVLGDTYDRVQEGKVASRNRQRAQLIVEYVTALPGALRQRVVSHSLWTHRLVPYADWEEAEAARALGVKGDMDEWQGRLASIARETRRVEMRLDKRLRSVDESLAAVRSTLSRLEGAVETARGGGN